MVNDTRLRKIVYYVATSIDGFICGPNSDIRGFVEKGSGIDQYLNDLANFDSVIMGRKTYEFGYRFGLAPGMPAYPGMMNYVFSNSICFEHPDKRLQVKRIDLQEIRNIRQKPGSDIYLCGGGEFAGWLLDNEQIQILKIKLNPLILGQGVRLFGNSKKKIFSSTR